MKWLILCLRLRLHEVSLVLFVPWWFILFHIRAS